MEIKNLSPLLIPSCGTEDFRRLPKPSLYKVQGRKEIHEFKGLGNRPKTMHFTKSGFGGTAQVFIDVMKGLGNASKSRGSRSLGLSSAGNVMNSRTDLNNSCGLISSLGGPAISAFTPAIPARFRFLLTDDSEPSLQNS